MFHIITRNFPVKDINKPFSAWISLIFPFPSPILPFLSSTFQHHTFPSTLNHIQPINDLTKMFVHKTTLLIVAVLGVFSQVLVANFSKVDFFDAVDKDLIGDYDAVVSGDEGEVRSLP